MSWFDFIEQVINKMGFYCIRYASRPTPIMCTYEYFRFENFSGDLVHEFYF